MDLKGRPIKYPGYYMRHDDERYEELSGMGVRCLLSASDYREGDLVLFLRAGDKIPFDIHRGTVIKFLET